jgi:hypothetical protein
MLLIVMNFLLLGRWNSLKQRSILLRSVGRDFKKWMLNFKQFQVNKKKYSRREESILGKYPPTILKSCAVLCKNTFFTKFVEWGDVSHRPALHPLSHCGFLLKFEEIRNFKHESCHSIQLAKTSRMNNITCFSKRRELLLHIGDLL